MQRPRKVTPFRDLLFEIREALSTKEFQQLVNESRNRLPEWKWRNLPNGETLQDRNELFVALEENGDLAHDNLIFLRNLLKKVKRDDLVKLVDNLQEKTNVKGPHHLVPEYAKLCDDILEGLREDEYIKLKELCRNKIQADEWMDLTGHAVYTDRTTEKARLLEALERNSSLGPDNLTFLIDSLEKIGRKDLGRKLKQLSKTINSNSVFNWKIMAPAGVVLVLMLYQTLFPGLTYFRTWWCCYGAIQPLRMVEFDITTMDYQMPHIRGVEFEWTALKEKLRLNFEKHPNLDMHYYLNLDRCGAGGVRHVRNVFFNLPQVRGAEVFAVDEKCKAVYFEHNNNWNRYRSARNITSPHCARTNKEYKEQSNT